MVENVVGVDTRYFHVDAVAAFAFHLPGFFAESFCLAQSEVIACATVNEVASEHGAVEAQFDKMAEAYKMDKEQIKGMFAGEQLDQLKEDVAVQEAIDFLVAEAKLVD